MHRFLSVCPSVTGPKLRRLENNSNLKKHSSWHVSRSDISFDGSKSKCWCHSKSINVTHDEVSSIWFPDELNVVAVEHTHSQWMEVASLQVASLHFASELFIPSGFKLQASIPLGSLWVIWLQLASLWGMAGGLTSTSSCIFFIPPPCRIDKMARTTPYLPFLLTHSYFYIWEWVKPLEK